MYARNNLLNAQLIQAIIRNDLKAVQQILAKRDSKGVPYADININVAVSFQQEPALLYAAGQNKNINPEIMLALLRVRDNENNVVSAVNESLLEKILSSEELKRSDKSRLVEEIVNLKDTNERRIYNLNNSRVPLLFKAIAKKDPQMVQLLLDIRTQDGNYAIDVNEPMNGPISITPLDYLELNPVSFGTLGYLDQENIRNILQTAGGVTAKDLTDAAKQHAATLRPLGIDDVAPRILLTPEPFTTYDFDQQLLQLQKQLKIFKNHASHLDEGAEKKTALQFAKKINRLMKAKNLFEEKEKEIFITECKKAMNTAKPTLSSSYQLKEIFCHIGVIIATLSLSLLAAAWHKADGWYHNRKNTHFFPPITAKKKVTNSFKSFSSEISKLQKY